jgi:hypothetical protein
MVIGKDRKISINNIKVKVFSLLSFWIIVAAAIDQKIHIW